MLSVVVAQADVRALIAIEIEHYRRVLIGLAGQIGRIGAGRNDLGDEWIQSFDLEFGEGMAVGEHVMRSAGGTVKPVHQAVSLS